MAKKREKSMSQASVSGISCGRPALVWRSSVRNPATSTVSLSA